MHREEELGGPLGHLTELGVPPNLLNFSGVHTERTSNTMLKAATKLQAATGNECYQHCLADSRYVPMVNRFPLCCDSAMRGPQWHQSVLALLTSQRCIRYCSILEILIPS